ncbi:NADH:flavin oxidoreductase [Sphingomonas montanisoli]|uniref:NADH:flavin oxidoreductase n=2 Tax=Sphingomonas montanisoli TaxID=2606412 RepID=A0A5D9CA49_9SPHN|nr:NADH:flavin oxidoreductase [Sphingomonas montanisoli]
MPVETDFSQDGEFRPAALFEPLDVGPMHLDNRIVMAPMTRSLSPNGIPGKDVAAYYRRRAEGGTGLIITEGTFIPHETAGFCSSVPDFHGDEALAGWKHVVDEVHAGGARIMPQLWHTGLMPLPTDDVTGIPAASPSGYYLKGDKRGEPATDALIADIIEAFGRAAESSVALGFDGLQIHAAHGYLIDQFFWSDVNLRDDRYGGGLVDRAGLGIEIVKECRRRTSPDYPISLRFSQWKQQDFAARLAQTPDELETFLAPFVDAGVDLFDCSTRRFWIPEFDGSDMNLAGWTKKLTGKIVSTVGSVSLSQDFFVSLQTEVGTSSNMTRLIHMLERGDFDLVSVGRALITDATWPQKVKTGDLTKLMSYNPADLNTLDS